MNCALTSPATRRFAPSERTGAAHAALDGRIGNGWRRLLAHHEAIEAFDLDVAVRAAADGFAAAERAFFDGA
jgi:hypothetical protein